MADDNEKTIIDKTIADAIDVPLSMAGKIACDHPMAIPDKTNCIDLQLSGTKRGRHGAIKIGWHDADPKKMCGSCACYWHLSCARNFALGVMR